MATKYECDRCGNQTDNQDAIGHMGYPTLNYNKNQVSGQASKDLCVDCLNELNEFMKPLPKQG